MASRKFCAPHVIAYWLTSASIAAFAASFSSCGHAKSGKPCARLIASCWIASRVMSRITDSVKLAAFRETRMFAIVCPSILRVVPGAAASEVGDARLAVIAGVTIAAPRPRRENRLAHLRQQLAYVADRIGDSAPGGPQQLGRCGLR